MKGVSDVHDTRCVCVFVCVCVHCKYINTLYVIVYTCMYMYSVCVVCHSISVVTGHMSYVLRSSVWN